MKPLLSNNNRILFLTAYLSLFVLTVFKVLTATSPLSSNNKHALSPYSEDIVSIHSEENKLCFKLPFYNENLLPLLFFEGSEREEKEEREDLESFALSQLHVAFNGFNYKFLIASVKSYLLSIDNRFVIPLYDFQHCWKTHCIV